MHIIAWSKSGKRLLEPVEASSIETFIEKSKPYGVFDGQVCGELVKYNLPNDSKWAVLYSVCYDGDQCGFFLIEDHIGLYEFWREASSLIRDLRVVAMLDSASDVAESDENETFYLFRNIARIANAIASEN